MPFHNLIYNAIRKCILNVIKTFDFKLGKYKIILNY